MGAFDFALASRSERGARTGNEDDLRTGQQGLQCHAVLADGAGGHARGAEAARRVVEGVQAALCAPGAAFDPATLTAALHGVHATLQQAQAGAVGRERMHATVVALWIDGRSDCALWSHVGDSRLYRLRYGAIERLTADDSVVQRLLESGALTAEQAVHHPMKNQLLAAMGMDERIEPHTPGTPVALEDGDAFLLCTDGWWGPLAESEMLATLREADTPAGWLAAMHRCIDARSGPEQDNYSAIALWVSDPAECTHPMDDAHWIGPG